MPAALLALSDWLAERGATQMAMESMGVYWKSVFKVLQWRFAVVVVNARHIKQLRGGKTDVKDCKWIAQLLQHGLLRASSVPPWPIPELSDLTRQRAHNWLRRKPRRPIACGRWGTLTPSRPVWRPTRWG
jgi:transposase